MNSKERLEALKRARAVVVEYGFDFAFNEAFDRIEELEESNKLLRASAEGNASRVEHLQAEIGNLKENLRIAKSNILEISELYKSAIAEETYAKARIDTLEKEIERLKAKLYDLSEKGD